VWIELFFPVGEILEVGRCRSQSAKVIELQHVTKYPAIPLFFVHKQRMSRSLLFLVNVSSSIWLSLVLINFLVGHISTTHFLK
jgi:hypothetical protein